MGKQHNDGFKCNHCEKSFCEMSTLREHRKIHTRDTFFTCKKLKRPEIVYLSKFSFVLRYVFLNLKSDNNALKSFKYILKVFSQMVTFQFPGLSGSGSAKFF